MDPSDSLYGLPRFRFLIRFSRWSPHHRRGSPALDCLSSVTCRPCYPGRLPAPLPLFQRARSGLPLLTTGSASPIRLRGYVWVHLRCGLLLRCRELTTPDHSDAAPLGYQVVRTTPWTGLQPASTHSCYCERSSLDLVQLLV